MEKINVVFTLRAQRLPSSSVWPSSVYCKLNILFFLCRRLSEIKQFFLWQLQWRWREDDEKEEERQKEEKEEEEGTMKEEVVIKMWWFAELYI